MKRLLLMTMALMVAWVVVDWSLAICSTINPRPGNDKTMQPLKLTNPIIYTNPTIYPEKEKEEARLATAIDGWRQSLEFSSENGKRTVRTIAPGNGAAPLPLNINRPVRNPHILGQVLWVDRNDEFAIAEHVSISPDGSKIFAGWWLNNMRYALYASSGLETPLWRYNLYAPLMLPVAASNYYFSGTGPELPTYIWEEDSPLNIGEINFDQGYQDVSFSGDSSMLAVTRFNSDADGILIVYDISDMDTVFVRHFVPSDVLNGVDFSSDGTRVLVSCYTQLYVFNVPSGDLLSSLSNYSSAKAKISGDGSRVISGDCEWGTINVVEWNGSEYVPLFSRYTGHDCVSAVDISKDGSTVACGTIDWDDWGGVLGGKFAWWDANTGDSIYSYTDYGDIVESVELSADGRYAVAGCWGREGATQGDVFTAFIRDTPVPIFQLQDDIDEPGSINSVALSDSGHYAVAGGKAVHNRQFGNGGMVYSIKIRDPLAHDAAISSIDAPAEFMAPGRSVTPTATFINVGNSTESFDVGCTVTNLENNQVIYSSNSSLSNVASFETRQVFFSPDFTLPSDGRFKIDFIATLASDLDNANNSLSLLIRSWHDLTGTGINSPFEEVTSGRNIVASASFKNLGSYAETVDILLSVKDSTGTEIHTGVATLYDFAPYQEEEVIFDPFIIDNTGSYRVYFISQAEGDFYPANDTLSKSFTVVQEMFYDDGIADFAVSLEGYPDITDRKIAVKFNPNLRAPFTISNVRFFQPPNPYTGTFDYVAVAPEGGDGLPDITNYLAYIENPELPGPGNWASFDLAVDVSQDVPLWFIMHWADIEGVEGPYVGADQSGIIDSMSYLYAGGFGWFQWTSDDWMMRMTLTEPVNPPGCQYIPGDINGNGVANGIDVIYGVSFFKGGPAPLVDCFPVCPAQPNPFYGAGDVNGSCLFNGIDITYFVAYLKGSQPALNSCPACPPAGGLAAPAVVKPAIILQGKGKTKSAD